LEDVSEGESPTGGIDIGEFKNCLHHADGLLSTIYRSRSKDGQLVALKVTTPHLMTRPHNSRREVRILREAASVHVIALLSVFEVAGGQLIIVFPFMKYNLDTLLHRDALTGAQVKSHLQDMFRALSYVHSLGVIHRDVKPSNILLNSPAGPAYLADFGISWKDGVSSSEPATEKIIDVGTTCYRPPELLFGSREYDTSLDLWAAGCVVAETVEMNHKPLFDSGPLGSELSLIQSIFKTLGTPDEEMWPVSSHQS
jgi:cyclin-dependent kinase